jgi:hypothetical protein
MVVKIVCISVAVNVAVSSVRHDQRFKHLEAVLCTRKTCVSYFTLPSAGAAQQVGADTGLRWI